jgi:hypothetical protein
MQPCGKLLAWIKPLDADEFVAAFVGEGAAPGAHTGFAGRAPAMQLCSTFDDAKQWIEQQAEAFGLAVEWVSSDPRG